MRLWLRSPMRASPSSWKDLPAMNKPYRRYEVLLPLRFNDGKAVPDELIADTLLELEERFGAVSCDSQTTHGHWRHAGDTYRDELVRLYVDVPDLAENREFFSQ